MAGFGKVTAGLFALSAFGAAVRAAPATNDQHVLGLKSFDKRATCNESFSSACTWLVEHYVPPMEDLPDRREIIEYCVEDICEMLPSNITMNALMSRDDGPPLCRAEADGFCRAFQLRWGIIKDKFLDKCTNRLCKDARPEPDDSVTIVINPPPVTASTTTYFETLVNGTLIIVDVTPVPTALVNQPRDFTSTTAHADVLAKRDDCDCSEECKDKGIGEELKCLLACKVNCGAQAIDPLVGVNQPRDSSDYSTTTEILTSTVTTTDAILVPTTLVDRRQVISPSASDIVVLLDGTLTTLHPSPVPTALVNQPRDVTSTTAYTEVVVSGTRTMLKISDNWAVPPSGSGTTFLISASPISMTTWLLTPSVVLTHPPDTVVMVHGASTPTEMATKTTTKTEVTGIDIEKEYTLTYINTIFPTQTVPTTLVSLTTESVTATQSVTTTESVTTTQMVVGIEKDPATVTVTSIPPSLTTTTVPYSTLSTVVVIPVTPVTPIVTSTPTVLVIVPADDNAVFDQCLKEHKVDQELGHCMKHHGDEFDHYAKCMCKETSKGMKLCANRKRSFPNQDAFHADNVKWCTLDGKLPVVLDPVNTTVSTTVETNVNTVTTVIPAYRDVHPTTSTHIKIMTIGQDIYGQTVWEKGAAGNLAIPLIGGSVALLAGIIGVAL